MDDILEKIKGIRCLENPKNFYITRCCFKLANTISSLNDSKRIHGDYKGKYLMEQLVKSIEI